MASRPFNSFTRPCPNARFRGSYGSCSSGRKAASQALRSIRHTAMGLTPPAAATPLCGSGFYPRKGYRVIPGTLWRPFRGYNPLPQRQLLLRDGVVCIAAKAGSYHGRRRRRAIPDAPRGPDAACGSCYKSVCGWAGVVTCRCKKTQPLRNVLQPHPVALRKVPSFIP